MATNYGPETGTRFKLDRKCRAYCPKFVATWAFQYPLDGEHRGKHTEKEREGCPIQPPAVSRRVNAQSTLPLCWLSGLMRSRTQRSSADVAELFIDCFYLVSCFTKRRYYLST